MPERRRRRSTTILACIVLVCALAILGGLVRAAGKDDSSRAWTGRWLGFVMGALSLGVGFTMIKMGKPGETHYWGLVGALTLAALFAGAYSYKTKTPQVGDRAKAIPIHIGDWTGTPVKVTEDTKNVLGTEDIIMRSYARKGKSVSLAVIFSMGKRKVAHPPEQCYSASGYEMEEIADDFFPTKDGTRINGRRLIITRGKEGKKEGQVQDQVVFYWYKAGDFNTGNFFKQQLYIILSAFNPFVKADTRVALIRLATHIKSLDEKKEALARVKAFAQEIFPEIEKALK